ncbi:MAG: glycosyltransferase family 1 protein [Patescibacteria group bacterium]|jgi:glycosyltransferase involved in cell wall biosynthesis
MKRIAIDCRLAEEGGVGRYIRNFVYYLSDLDRENEYTLWTCENSNFESRNPKQSSNFKIKKTEAKWHSFDEQMKFWKELEEDDYDLVHFPYFSHPIFYRRPFVVTIHDLTILHFATGKATTKNPLVYLAKRLGYLVALQHAINGSKKIIVPTDFVKKDIEKRYHTQPDRIVVTYEGVGENMSDMREENPLDKIPEKYYLYVGNFYPHKNVEFLLRSFKHLKQPNHLVLAGPNDFFTNRIRLVVEELGLSRSVSFVSRPSDENLKYLYTHAQALVLPSLFEGFGLPIVEAVYFHCPLLLSDIPVFHEIALPGTVFFNPRDEKDLAEKLARTPKHIEPGKQYFDRFSFEKMSKDTLQVYKDALS